MKIGRWQITKLPKLVELKRTLPLEWIYQFPCGTDIYTFRDSDLAQISGRYYDQVKQELQFLAEYGIDLHTVEKYDEKMQELIAEGLGLKRSMGEVMADMKRVMDEKKSLFKFNKDLNRNMWLNLYCFFFVLSGEPELHFSEAENRRKIELLEKLPEAEQDFFFNWLELKVNAYSDTYRSVIADYTISLAEQAVKIKGGSLGDSLNMLTEMMNSTSPPPDGQG